MPDKFLSGGAARPRIVSSLPPGLAGPGSIWEQSPQPLIESRLCFSGSPSSRM